MGEIIPSNRRVTWQGNVGIPGGVPLRTTIYKTLSPTGSDDTAAINNALLACPAGQVVMLSAGKFTINTAGTSIRLKPNVTLRGSGIGKTVLSRSIGGSAITINNMCSGSASEPIAADVAAGAAAVTMTAEPASGIPLQAGNYIQISEWNDGVIAQGGTEGIPNAEARNFTGGATTNGSATFTSANPVFMARDANRPIIANGIPGHTTIAAVNSPTSVRLSANATATATGLAFRINYGRTVGQYVKIVSRNGKVLTFDPPLNWHYETNLSAKVMWDFKSGDPTHNFIENAGVEDLTVKNEVTATGTYAVPGGYISAAHTIDIKGAAHCWVKDVELVNVGDVGISMIQSFGCEIRENYIHGGSTYNGSGSGYGIEVRWMTTNSLIENNIEDVVRAPFVVDLGIQGNVFGYNYVHSSAYGDGTTQAMEVSYHGAHPMFNLWEGNILHKFQSDDYHGSSSHNTALRNWIKGMQPTTSEGNWAFVLDDGSHYHNVVGNILGCAGFTPAIYESPSPGRTYNTKYIYSFGYINANGTSSDPAVAATVLRHGNYDSVHRAQMWDPTISDHTIPNSYYLAAKPAWFGALKWPPIDPAAGVPSSDSIIPAAVRFSSLTGASTPTAPSPPTNLSIVQ